MYDEKFPKYSVLYVCLPLIKLKLEEQYFQSWKLYYLILPSWSSFLFSLPWHENISINLFFIYGINIAPFSFFLPSKFDFTSTYVFHLLLQVTQQVMDEKLGRVVTRVVLPNVVMHSRYHYGVIFSPYNQCYISFLWEAYIESLFCLRLMALNFWKSTIYWWVLYWQAFSENFTGLELEDGGGRGTSGFSFSCSFIIFLSVLPSELCLIRFSYQ